ncbi:hypothetical protein UFOVP325_50 [uncultured Caudovirales phage]|uniref:Uncharacterized protein n=1 Tax=uncultured Caudovirales phage TaxID=2100421 RepID=A0A6J5LXD8_9CAUD|nr:hypothetical protein UFOVP325_50 [uncultured Caudovirales phage]CAB4147800.1 hypothetical protein UFOVP430_45 [uncultured Caudovirales phage]
MEIRELVLPNMAYVDADGSYGVGAIAIFQPDRLTDEQWETLANLSDSERLEYVVAILDGEDLSRWENADD